MATNRRTHRDPARAGGGSSGSTLLRPAEVLEATGITHQVLYRYKTLGLIEPVSSGRGRRGLYHPDVVTLIHAIQILSRTGYSLRDIKEIFFKDERVRRAICGVDPAKERKEKPPTPPPKPHS